jgi:hypothetical protein
LTNSLLLNFFKKLTDQDLLHKIKIDSAGTQNFHPDAPLNRPDFELTPRSWTNFKGFHEEVSNGVQAQCRQELSGWGGWSEAAS